MRTSQAGYRARSSARSRRLSSPDVSRCRVSRLTAVRLEAHARVRWAANWRRPASSRANSVSVARGRRQGWVDGDGPSLCPSQRAADLGGGLQRSSNTPFGSEERTMHAGAQGDNGDELAVVAVVVIQPARTGGRRGPKENGDRRAGQRRRTGAEAQRVRGGRFKVRIDGRASSV